MANFCIRIAAVLAALASLLPAQENTQPTNGAKPVDAVARGRNTTFGVVDLDKAIDQYPKAIAELERLKQLRKDCGEQVNAETKRIDDLKGQLSLLKEGSRERRGKEFELRRAVQNREELGKFLNDQLEVEFEKFKISIYQDLDVAVERVAKDRGVLIVFRVRPQAAAEESAKEPASAQQERLFTYNRREVLFAADEVDLTPALIKYLQVPIELNKPAPGKTEPGKTETPVAPKTAGNGNGGL